MSNMKQICDSNKGRIFLVKKVPSSLFEFFLCKRRELKDGTESWDIGISPASQPHKGLVLENIHGTKEDAEARLTEILKEAAAKDREISWNDNAPHAE